MKMMRLIQSLFRRPPRRIEWTHGQMRIDYT